MKLLLIPLLFLSVLVNGVYAQDWALFPLHQKSLYSITVDNKTYAHSINLDGEKQTSTGKVQYFDSTYKSTVPCYYEIKNQLNFFIPSSLFEKPDSLVINTDSTLIYTNYLSYTTNEFVKDTLLFITKAKVGETWQANSYTTISCIDIAYQTLFDTVKDSVKTWKIESSYCDDFLITLSKNYGLVTMHSFNALFNAKEENSFIEITDIYTLSGFENSQQKEGLIKPKFNDYFRLQTGDILFLRDYYYYTNVITQYYWLYFYKDSIVSSFHSPDSVHYLIHRSTYSENGTLLSQRNYTQFHLKSQIGTFLSAPTNSLGVDDNSVFITNSLSIITKDRIDYPYNYSIAYLTDSCQINFYHDFTGSRTYSSLEGFKHLNTYQGGGAGETNTNYSVMGSIINGKKYGNTTLPTQVGINAKSLAAVKLFPNPVSNQLHVDFGDIPTNYIQQIVFTDILGRTCLISEASTTIDMSYLAKGLYFVKLIDTANNSMVSTVVKE